MGLVKKNRDFVWGSCVSGEEKRGMSFSASHKEVKMKPGLSLSMTFVDFDECETGLKSCLQGTINKPRLNPSKLVGTLGMNSRTKLSKTGPATAFRK